MAELTPRKRANLQPLVFCLPVKSRTPDAGLETGYYPMPDAGHAISAKRRSKKQLDDGNLTKDEFERINRKADKVLDENKKS
jgi:hypothetical protein